MENVVWWLHVQTVQSYVGVSCMLVETFLMYCFYWAVILIISIIL
jgi:hypothetical protein